MLGSPHEDKLFTASETVRDIAIGMSGGLRVQFLIGW
jgi:hypothetical protein